MPTSQAKVLANRTCAERNCPNTLPSGKSQHNRLIDSVVGGAKWEQPAMKLPRIVFEAGTATTDLCDWKAGRCWKKKQSSTDDKRRVGLEN